MKPSLAPHPSAQRLRFAASALCAVAVLVAGRGLARAEEDPLPQEVPAAAGLVLDGRMDEAAWASAIRVPATSVEVPDLAAPSGTRPLNVDVRLLRDASSLWIGVRADEAPGPGLGLHVFVAGPDALTAADAWGVTYRPFELRADRLTVLAPFVDARVHFPVDAAADVSRVETWSLEARLPLAPIHEETTAPLSVGMAVLTRTPNVVADAPAGALARGPAAWLTIAAPEDGWATMPPDVAAIEEEVQRELRRRVAFTSWLQALFSSPDAETRPEARMASRLAARLWMEAPLTALAEARPDLAVPLAVARGDVFERMGFFEEAEAAYDAALAEAPGWREARYGRDARLAARRALEAPAGGPTDPAAQDARIQALAAAAGDDPWKQTGVALARAELAYRRNDPAAASALLEPLRARFPGDAWIVQLSERVKAALESEPAERIILSTPREPRPRVRIETPHGPIVVELFEDDALQAVSQWMWLVSQGFYDGLGVHHTAPGCWVAAGDPGSAADASAEARAAVGTGGAGYDIEAPDSPRRPRRGALALERPAEQLVGSRFLFLTGAMGELSDALVVIGHVVEGEAQMDALRQGDRLGPYTIERAREGTVYRPLGRDGSPAPVPSR